MLINTIRHFCAYTCRRVILPALPLFFCGGCTYGLLYTDQTEPLTVKMHETKIVTDAASGRQFILRVPVTPVSLEVNWASRGIGDAAKTEGLEVVRYADMRTQSYVLGIWQRKTVLVYGDMSAEDLHIPRTSDAAAAK